jgi:hypothetical protein
MTIKEKEDNFFADYPIGEDKIVRDGIVEEGSYSTSSPKILFLLKEANSPEKGEWSLIKHIREDQHAPTFDTLARWTVGIRSLPRDLPWEGIKDISPYSRICALNYVVLFNLKKVPGYGTTDEIALEKFAEKYADLLREQFSFYNPDIVICCGKSVGRLFNNFILPNNEPWPNTKGNIPYRKYEPNKFVIAYSHPQARVNKESQYYGIVNAVKEIFFKGK